MTNTKDYNFFSRESEEVPPEGPLEEVCSLTNGYTLYRRENGCGGHTYWSDEIGGGVVVWDTCLVCQESLLIALAQETIRRDKEKREKTPST